MKDFNAELQTLSQRVLNKELKQSTIIDAPEKEVVLYQTEDGNVDVSVFYYQDTFWLTQKAMGELFGCSSDNISLHLKNIFTSGELDKNSVTEKFSATASDGKKYNTQFYNLDAIISVGYRVNSISYQRKTQFRIFLKGCSLLGSPKRKFYKAIS